MTRDIASSFNHLYGETFVLPDAKIDDALMTIPGTDGQKMSKSYGNTIDIFVSEKELKKQVMSIITDSTPLEEPKNPDVCNVFQIYKLLATPDQTQAMRINYEGGNYGYGHAKKALLELILETFKDEREKFAHFMHNTHLLEAELQKGEAKARKVALVTLNKVRSKLGFN